MPAAGSEGTMVPPQWQVGYDQILALDHKQQWFPAKITKVDHDKKRSLIHFKGWHARFDFWAEWDSDRVVPIDTNSTASKSVTVPTQAKRPAPQSISASRQGKRQCLSTETDKSNNAGTNAVPRKQKSSKQTGPQNAINLGKKAARDTRPRAVSSGDVAHTSGDTVLGTKTCEARKTPRAVSNPPATSARSLRPPKLTRNGVRREISQSYKTQMDRSGNILEVLRKDKSAQNIRDNISRHKPGSPAPGRSSATSAAPSAPDGNASTVTSPLSTPARSGDAVVTPAHSQSLGAQDSDTRQLSVDDPLSALLGRSLVKNFRGYGSFVGTVTGVNDDSNAVTVQFEDGDTKVMSKRAAISAINGFLNTFKHAPSSLSSTNGPSQLVSTRATATAGTTASPKSVQRQAAPQQSPATCQLTSASTQSELPSPTTGKRSQARADSTRASSVVDTSMQTKQRTARRRILSTRQTAASATPTHAPGGVAVGEGSDRDQTPETHSVGTSSNTTSSASIGGNLLGIKLPDTRQEYAVLTRAEDAASDPSASPEQLRKALRGVLDVTRSKDLYAKTLESKLKVANEISVLLGQALTAAQ
eukprot:m.296416 g.296416  ORF g.296416 m.296416 type:complete len:588 (-) comp20061_c0_seq2:439-2202(-)